MESIDTNYCDSCGKEIDAGIQFKACKHWICAECIIRRGTRKTHTFGKDSLLCPKCGVDTGLVHDELIDKFRDRVK
ncbi:MAG: hypothetical protein WBG43_00065 [Marinifilaceae bacterium]